MKINGIEIPDILLHLLLLPALPVVLVGLVILAIFRQLVIKPWLQIKFGRNFGGLLCGADKVYTPPFEVSRKLISTVNYARSDKKIDVLGRIKRNVIEKIYNRPRDYPKLTATYHSFLGQVYLLNNQVALEDIVKTIPLPSDSNVAFDEEYLKEYVGSLSNSPLPKNDTALWDIHVATEPLVNMNPQVKGYVYPFLIRFHHAVSDGVRLVTFVSILLDGKFSSHYYDKLSFENGNGKSIVDDLVNVAKYILYILYLIVTAIVSYLNMSYLKENVKNPIHGHDLSGEKLIAWTLEYDSKHVDMVKKIKNRIPNTRFTDVIFACISSSVCDFFKKKNYDYPNKISCIIPILIVDPNVERSKPIELKNEFTFGPLEMPMVNASNFLKGLEEVKLASDRMRKCPEKDLLYWITNHISASVPGQVINLIQNTKAYTCTISSVPGINRMQILGDCDLLSTVASAPHTNYTGVTFTVFTYDNKFQICILVDKALISEQEDAQYIVDQILRNMEVLNEESLKVYS